MKVILLALCFVAALAKPHQRQLSAWDEDCGRSQYPDAGIDRRNRIVGGVDARPGEYPWQVSLRRSTGSHFCGGVIMNPKWVLTAAHCVTSASGLTVVVGEHDRSASNTFRRSYDVAVVLIHEDYGDLTSFDADIALLALSEKITYNERVQPACPPLADNLYVGSTSTISGWGTLRSGGSTLPNILQWINSPVPTNAACEASLGNTITAGMICAGNIPENEKDSCQGDSGGPMTVKNSDDRFELVGLVSWGRGCASGTPGVYARVSEYLDWIDSKVVGFEF